MSFRIGIGGFTLLIVCLLAGTAAAQAYEVNSRSGHRYVLRAGEWYLVASAADPDRTTQANPNPLRPDDPPTDGDPDQTTQAVSNPIRPENPPTDGDPDQTTQAQRDDDAGLLRIDTRRIVVRVDSDWNPVALEHMARVPRPRGVGRLLPGGFRTIDVPQGVDPFAYLDRLEQSRGIRWARFDVYAKFFSTPNDPLFSSQWGLSESVSRLPSAWSLSSATPIKVAILDSGAQQFHPDMDNVILGAASQQFSMFADELGHGTAVAGIVAARTNNGTGVAGVGDPGVGSGSVELLILKVNDFAQPGGEIPDPSMASVADAITYAADQGARVINLSLGNCVGTGATFPEIDAAIAYATHPTRDVVIVAASGNLCAAVAYPAKDPRCIAVGVVTPVNSSGGSWGPRAQLDILAPGGGDIVTTDMSGEDGYSSDAYTCSDGSESCFGGTSASAPFITGVVALMRRANPSLTRTQVYDILVHSADKIPGMGGAYSTYQHGYGKVNALGAVVGALYDAQFVQGTYNTNQTWPSTVKPFHNLYLPGDVRVESGTTVNITPKTDISGGVNVYMETSDAADLETGFSDKVELITKGTLNVNGTSSRRVTFRSRLASPGENDWAHHYVLGNGNLSLAYADIQNSQYGISSSSAGTIAVSHSAFASNATTDIKLGGSPSSATIGSSTFTVGGGRGVELTGTSASVSGNTFGSLGSGAVAIWAEGTAMAATIAGNTITSSGTGTGVQLGSGSATLTNNEISGCDRGIQVTNGPHMIGGGGSHATNTLEGNNYGIYAQCSGPGSCPASCAPLFATVRYNLFDGNGKAVHTIKTAAVDLGTTSDPGNNIILDSGTCSISNSSSCGVIAAQGNWWGACEAPTDLCGEVDATNELCAPPGVESRIDLEPAMASGLTIHSIVPNPTADGTTIQFSLGAPTEQVVLSIYDVSGRLVRNVEAVSLAAGAQSLRWNGRNSQGSRVSRGIYFARLRAGAHELRSKVLVISP